MSISDLTHAGLEQAINQHISMDQNAGAQMAQLHGRVIALEVLGTGHTLYLVPGPEMIQLLSSYEGEPDCLLQGSPLTITQLRRPVPEGEDPVPTDMRVSGESELAQQFCRILRGVEINWEAYLSQYTGSLIAGEVSKAIDFAAYWRDHIIDTLNRDLREYLQEEGAVLPTQHEIDAFGNGVLQLEQRLRQLQQRIERLTGIEGESR
ncbi:MAG: hypothetical protein GY753_00855 [Gammaproteobacteria bacterium]|nr:hypothetical protein [Gammaproteobacteria bacterium]